MDFVSLVVRTVSLQLLLKPNIPKLYTIDETKSRVNEVPRWHLCTRAPSTIRLQYIEN